MGHLEDIKLTYLQHLILAIFNAFRLTFASVILVIHGVFPFLFQRVASGIVKDVEKSFVYPLDLGDKILVRFNTKWQEDNLKRQWRVLVNGNETLAAHVCLRTGSYTVEEAINGEQKFHFLCRGKVVWVGNNAIIE